MKAYFLFCLICLFSAEVLYAKTSNVQAIYVDCSTGDDNNKGTVDSPIRSINKAVEIIKSKENDIYTVKINPGIYILDNHVSVSTEKDMTGKRIVIEASILPDDTSWTPEQMPVIISRSKKGEIMLEDAIIKDYWITGFYIDESHVTIRGLKFLGHNHPVNIYYPISRFNKAKTDLLVEQCMFLADLQTSSIQVGVIAHGDSIRVEHCIFYGANNSVVYWEDSGNGIKTGNSMTYCIVYGTSESAVYPCYTDKDFIFKNNVISNCRIFWSTCPEFNTAQYSLDSCVVVNCEIYTGNGEKPVTFALNETNVIKEGNISLRKINTIWQPLPKDHLHVIPGTLGYEIGAGLFKSGK
jgi:hypothetical protein